MFRRDRNTRYRTETDTLAAENGKSIVVGAIWATAGGGRGQNKYIWSADRVAMNHRRFPMAGLLEYASNKMYQQKTNWLIPR